METITKEKFIRTFREKQITLFSGQDIFKLFSLKPSSAKALLGRLKEGEIIKPLTRGKYLFLLAATPPEEFEIANFIYAPSYVSLESALSFYGIIEQFPYQISSITLKKTKLLKIGEKTFTYSRIKPEFFIDYQREKNFLIAGPKKAIFDFLYFAYKGIRTKNNLRLLRPERINLKKSALKEYLLEIAGKKDKNFIRFCQKQKII